MEGVVRSGHSDAVATADRGRWRRSKAAQIRDFSLTEKASSAQESAATYIYVADCSDPAEAVHGLRHFQQALADTAGSLFRSICLTHIAFGKITYGRRLRNLRGIWRKGCSLAAA